MMRTTLPRRRLSLVVLAALGLAALGAGSSRASDPFVAGDRSTRVVPASTAELTSARERGRQLALALGLAAASTRAERLDDRFDHRVVDEVTALDASGREIAIARFEPGGELVMASTLGWHDARAAALDRSTAASRAAAVARSAGVHLAGTPDARRSAGSGGWVVGWNRTEAGIPVRGDGVRVLLWSDGSFHAIVRTERALAAAAGHRIPADDARRAADAVLDRLTPSRSGLVATRPELAWLAGNDAFGGPRADAPSETLRLAWVVRFDASGPLTDRVRSLEIWIDAVDGSLLGGDIVE